MSLKGRLLPARLDEGPAAAGAPWLLLFMLPRYCSASCWVAKDLNTAPGNLQEGLGVAM